MRGNKLFALYSSHNSLSEIDDQTRKNWRVAYLTRRSKVYSEVKTIMMII